MSDLHHIVLYSGGIGSWAAAKRLRDGGVSADRMTLLFTDTKTEDADTYRWLHASAATLGLSVTVIADGRTIWQVFRDVRMLGNSRIDPCSQVLKRRPTRRWIADHFQPESAVVVVGIDWTERHRFDRMQARWAPWRVIAPLCDAPYLMKQEFHQAAEAAGLWKQRLYVLGAPHANCGGGCVKAGVGHFVRLLHADRDRYLEWETEEEGVRQHLQRDVSILRRTEGGVRERITLRELREEVEAGAAFDLFEIGGCGCMIDEPDDPLVTEGA